MFAIFDAEVLTPANPQAGFQRPRAQVVLASALIVALLSTVFAAAISSALQAPSVPDAAQVAIEGGL